MGECKGAMVEGTVLAGADHSNLTTLYQPLDHQKHHIRLVRILYYNDHVARSNTESYASECGQGVDKFKAENEASESKERGEVELRDIMKCEMKTFPVDFEAPKYTAISYTWTEAKATSMMQLNDKTVWVRPNLYAFLKQMYEERYRKWMFIDALCIDQRNISERNHQVASMGDVFRYAVKVIAWLGELDSPSSHMRALCEKTTGGEVSLYNALLAPSMTVKVKEECMHCLLAGSYWDRVWIVQEIVLACSLQFRAGALSIDWKSLHLLCKFPDGHRSRRQYDVFRLLEFRSEAQHRRGGRAPLMLGVALNITLSRQCSEVHDKVYGLLGLTQNLIKTDYDMSADELGLRTCIAALLEAGCHKSHSAGRSRQDFRQMCKTMIRLVMSLSKHNVQTISFVALQLAMERCAHHSVWSNAHTPAKIAKLIRSHVREYHISGNHSDPQTPGDLVGLTFEEMRARVDMTEPESIMREGFDNLVGWVQFFFDDMIGYLSELPSLSALVQPSGT